MGAFIALASCVIVTLQFPSINKYDREFCYTIINIDCVLCECAVSVPMQDTVPRQRVTGILGAGVKPLSGREWHDVTACVV